jgi:fructosamine-3-kinase
MDAGVRAALEEGLGERVVGQSALGGGDINQAYQVQLQSGRAVFVKSNPTADPMMFPTEARGLRWLEQAAALRVPKVLAVSSGAANAPAFLALEYLRPAARRRNYDEELGCGLARLHRHGAAQFGLDHDNFIGRLPQPNAPTETWEEFYRERRLGDQLRIAAAQGRATSRMQRGFAQLFAKLGSLLGPPEPPARLHGDLWGGNLHVDDDGGPCVIDPAVYAGHREIDLSMMQLFGGFGPRVFGAYQEEYPLTPGHQERVPLYQLYPLMVHVNHFGGSYGASVERVLSRYL